MSIGTPIWPIDSCGVYSKACSFPWQRLLLQSFDDLKLLSKPQSLIWHSFDEYAYLCTTDSNNRYLHVPMEPVEKAKKMPNKAGCHGNRYCYGHFYVIKLFFKVKNLISHGYEEHMLYTVANTAASGTRCILGRITIQKSRFHSNRCCNGHFDAIRLYSANPKTQYDIVLENIPLNFSMRIPASCTI